MDRGCMCAYACACALRKIAVILLLIPGHAFLVYCVPLWYLTSMSRSIDSCQNKVSAFQSRSVTISYRGIIARVQAHHLTKCRFLIGSRAYVWLTFRKPVNDKPAIKMFFTASVCVVWGYSNWNEETKQFKKKDSPQSYKTQIWFSLILLALWSFEQPCPVALLFKLNLMYILF